MNTITAGFLLAAISLARAIDPQTRPADPQAIREVAEGKRTEAKAVWWGFNPADATSALQAAIRSGARKVIVEDMDAPWVVDKIQLGSDQEIVFEKGVLVQAKRGAFRGKTDSLFSATGCRNLTLTGHGATLKMWKDDYTGPDYAKSEWRHLLAFRSCENVRVSGLTLADSGGDGIYLGATRPTLTNRGIEIRDVTCINNHRQGISVISAEDLLIEHCAFLDTSGTAPQSGIDFEPNNPEDRLVNCVLRDCRSENNRGEAYQFYLRQLRRDTAPISIRLERCTAKGCQQSVNFTSGNAEADAVGGSVEFIDCRFDAAEREAIEIRQKPAAGCRMRFVNCVITNPTAQHSTLSPITFSSVSGNSEDLGGIEFSNCTLTDAIERRPLAFVDAAGEVRLKDVSGSLVVTHDGKSTTHALNQALLEAWFPAPTIRRFPKVKTDLARLAPVATGSIQQVESMVRARVRDSATWLVWVEQGSDVAFSIRIQPVGRQEVRDVPVRCVSPSGKEVHLKSEGAVSDRTFSFRATEAGAHRVTCQPQSLTAELIKASGPACLFGDGAAMHLLGAPGELHFWVPEGVTAFGIKLAGGGGTERVKAALFNAQGQLVDEKDDIDRATQFAVDRGAPSRGEVWRLRLARPTHGVLEDFTVELQGIPALLSSSPTVLLREK